MLLNHKTIPTRGASAPQKPVRVHPKPGYAVGEETRTGTGPLQRQDRPPPRSTAVPTPRRSEALPAPTAGAPRRTAGPTAEHPRRPAARPTADSAPTIGSRTVPRPATAPTEPRQRTPRPDARRQPPRRPGRPQDAASAALLLIYTHQQPQPASGPRWTTGPAADHPHTQAARPLTVYIMVGIYSHHNHNRIICYHNNI